jgi:hypothetical protein
MVSDVVPDRIPQNAIAVVRMEALSMNDENLTEACRNGLLQEAVGAFERRGNGHPVKIEGSLRLQAAQCCSFTRGEATPVALIERLLVLCFRWMTIQPLVDHIR